MISNKLYVSHHIFFLEHVHFFSIPIKSHNTSKFELAHIDHFLDDTFSFPTETGTLVPDHHAHFFSFYDHSYIF